MARRFWPNQRAVGKTFQLSFGDGQKHEVIGVSRDYRVHAVNERPTPYLHFAAAQRPALLPRCRAHARQRSPIGDIARRELLTLEPGLVFINSATMETSLALSLLPSRVAAMLATGFGVIGTLLAGIGLYGVIAFSVARRTREIGVRVAIGADRRDVLRLIMARSRARHGRCRHWCVACRWNCNGARRRSLPRERARSDCVECRSDGAARAAAGAANLISARRAMRLIR